MEARGRVTRQGENVSRQFIQQRHFDTGLPLDEYLAEVFGTRCLDAAPVYWLQSHELLVERAADRLIICVQRASQSLAQLLDLGNKALLPGIIAVFLRDLKQFAVIVESPVGRDIERSPVPASMDHEHAPRAHAVPDAELIEYIGIENRDIGQHRIRRDELKKHV